MQRSSILLALLLTAGALQPARAESKLAAPIVPADAPLSTFVDDVSFGKDPFWPKSGRRPKSMVKAVTSDPPGNVPDSIVLKGIAVQKDKKLAIVNNTTAAEGEEFSVRTGSQVIRVKCVEIKEKSVIINVNGVTKELPLRAPF